MGSSGRKASKKENQLGRTSLWTKEGRRYRGGQTCPLLPAAPLQGASSWGAGAPSISGFILCCPPLPPWGVYPSSCYKGSILTNIIKNQGEAQGEPGSGRDIKDLEAFGPSNGEEVDALEEISVPFSSSHTPLLCRRSRPRFLLMSSASCVSIEFPPGGMGPQPLSGEPPLHLCPLTFGPGLTQRRQRAQVVCLLAPEGQVAGSPSGKTRRKQGREGPIGGEGAQGSTLLHWGGAAVQGAYSLRSQLRFPYHRDGLEGELLPQTLPLGEAVS